MEGIDTRNWKKRIRQESIHSTLKQHSVSCRKGKKWLGLYNIKTI